MAKWTIPDDAPIFGAKPKPIDEITIKLERFSSEEAPMIFHEKVGDGEFNGDHFEVIRSVPSGMHIHVRMTDETVTFNIMDIVEAIVRDGSSK